MAGEGIGYVPDEAKKDMKALEYSGDKTPPVLSYEEDRAGALKYEDDKTKALTYEEDRAGALKYEEDRTGALKYEDDRSGALTYEERKALPGKEDPGKEPPSIDKTIVLANTNESIAQHARDVAESRLTEKPAELKGIGGFFKKLWKHNLGRELYRQAEIAKITKEIKTGGLEGNIYAGEVADKNDTTAHDAAMGAIVDRFTSEYEESVHKEAGETKDELLNPEAKALVTNIIRRYATSPTLSRADFVADKKTMLGQLAGLEPTMVQAEDLYADNIWKIVEQVRANIESGMSIDKIDLDFQIYIAKAKEGVRTEAQMNSVDRITEKIMHSKVGPFVNETTVAIATAIVAGVAINGVQKLANSQLAHYLTFGASAVVSAFVGGAKENVRMKEERRQHSREGAQGKETLPADSPRRAEMEKTRYETASAQSLIDALDTINSYETGEASTITQEQFDAALGAVATADARVILSDDKSIDLICYSDVKNVDTERRDLDVARGKAKKKMKQILADSGGAIKVPGDLKLEDYLGSSREVEMNRLTNEEINAKDSEFAKIKAKHIAKAIVKGFLTGLAFGVIAEEIGAFFDNTKEGILEHVKDQLINHKIETGEAHTTALEAFRQWLTGEANAVASNPAEIFSVSPECNVELPAGTDMTQNPDGTFTFVDAKGTTIPGLQIGEDGKFTPDSLAALKADGVNVTTNTIPVETAGTRHVEGDPKAFVENNKNMEEVHRHMWYDNDTTGKFDKNELGLHWGGDHGVDSSGNYVMSVKSMLPEGSFHDGSMADPTELMKEGHLKLLLSVSGETQSHVFEIPIGPDGNAIIDPNSEAGKMLFHTDADGHAIFNGKFAEVAQMLGTEKDGADGVRILATHIGENSINKIDMDIPTTEVHDHVKNVLDMPGGNEKQDFVMPPVVPIVERTPLEPNGKKKERDGGAGLVYEADKYEPRAYEGEDGPDYEARKADYEAARLAAYEAGTLAEFDKKHYEPTVSAAVPTPESADGRVPEVKDEEGKESEQKEKYRLRNVEMTPDQAKLLEETNANLNNLDKAIDDGLLKYWKDQETIDKGIDYNQIMQEALHNPDQFADKTDEMKDYLTARLLGAWGRHDTRNRIEQQRAIDAGTSSDNNGGVRELGRAHYENDPKQVEWAKTHAEALAAIVRLLDKMDPAERANVDVYDFITKNKEAIKAEVNNPTTDPLETATTEEETEEEAEETQPEVEVTSEDTAQKEEEKKKGGVFQNWITRYNQRRQSAAEAREKSQQEQQSEAEKIKNDEAAEVKKQADLAAEKARLEQEAEKARAEELKPAEFAWTAEQEAKLDAGTLTNEELKGYIENLKSKSPEEIKNEYGVTDAARNEKTPITQLNLLRNLPVRKLLGLPKQFGAAQLEDAFRKTMATVNPNFNGGSASNTELFIAIQEFRQLIKPFLK